MQLHRDKRLTSPATEADSFDDSSRWGLFVLESREL